MSESEDFLARWSRLKREAALAGNGSSEQTPAAPPPVAGGPSAAAFDPASLPPIESIDAATDIRPFLEASVPEELTRAALRNTWSVDPAIRDFIGIAENQWDFNDPGTIPGFGVHTATAYLSSLVADSANLDTGGTPPASAEGDPAEGVNQVDARLSELPHDTGGAPTRPAEAAAAQQRVSADDLGPPLPRAHGGALPR